MLATTTIREEIELIAEAGDAADALDLVRTLTREGHTNFAIRVRRTVTAGNLDRNALRAIVRDIARAQAESAALFTPQMLESLYAVEAALRASFRQSASVTPAESAAAWTARQRYAERVDRYNAEVGKVNRARGLAANKRQAAAVRATTCGNCFQVPAANGVCGC